MMILPPGRIKLSRQQCGLMRAKTNGDDEEDALESILKLLATPIKILSGTKPIALAYPLVLLGASAFLPASTAVILDGFFAGFWLLGRNVIGDDDDDDDSELSMSSMVDLAALVGAIASAGLLAPNPISTSDNSNFGEGLGVTALALASAAVVRALASDNVDDSASASNAVDGRTNNASDILEEVIDPFQQEMLDSWDIKLRGDAEEESKERGKNRRR